MKFKNGDRVLILERHTHYNKNGEFLFYSTNPGICLVKVDNAEGWFFIEDVKHNILEKLKLI